MSNTSVSSANLGGSSNGQNFPQVSGRLSRTMTGDGVAVLNQDVGSAAWVQLVVPSNISGGIGELLIVVGTPAATGTIVKIALDNAGAQLVSDGIPIGGGQYACSFAHAAPYLKSDATGADTVPVQVFIAAR